MCKNPLAVKYGFLLDLIFQLSLNFPFHFQRPKPKRKQQIQGKRSNVLLYQQEAIQIENLNRFRYRIPRINVPVTSMLCTEVNSATIYGVNPHCTYPISWTVTRKLGGTELICFSPPPQKCIHGHSCKSRITSEMLWEGTGNHP